ncbi:probable tRNA-splicing endonuclease subunit Sen2 isoform X2 [Elaeis guineensis]|nr:probable tRNA-splicing endonuclease subunit Sen2 isoform X2 [Elaeis guineensis]XP_010931835.1 probable tRNA-splicing endonuclease subunit Sen2 isoform X2 [Elaeis guineensis]XP_029122707.1 probable tRNA-splicing endonuclease subunit Sen2 isoform X2 [Elaeis guineensis]
MELGRPRWKGKAFADIAHANPMSEIVTQLQVSLTQSKTYAMLSGCDILLEAGLELADLLSKASFGRGIVTSNKGKQWFQLGPEEAFYLCHALKCLKVSRDNETCMSEMELWDHFRSNREAFPEFYKAYFHLRSKNWVVRSGIQYGVDYVAYRHHPALVHSEYAVLVVADGDGDASSGRLRVWSDLHCTLRVCGSVAKTLLVLTVRRYGSDRNSLNCLEEFIVEERTITRWVPERCREDQGLEEALGVD